jgi:hypothetical protein
MAFDIALLNFETLQQIAPLTANATESGLWVGRRFAAFPVSLRYVPLTTLFFVLCFACNSNPWVQKLKNTTPPGK